MISSARPAPLTACTLAGVRRGMSPSTYPKRQSRMSISNPPPILGGQGREPEDIEGDTVSLLVSWFFLLVFCIVAWVLASTCFVS
jgi:hypothetical protein